MAPVLAVKEPEKQITSSNVPEDIYRCLGSAGVYVEDKPINLPARESFFDDEWKHVFPCNETSAFVKTAPLEIDMVDSIQSPLMPPKKRYRLRVKIRNIKKGLPSLCDEIEI